MNIKYNSKINVIISVFKQFEGSEMKYLVILGIFLSLNLYATDNKSDVTKTIMLGDDIRLTCNDLNDIAKVQWFKDGVMLRGENSDKLLIKNATLAHSGTYWAVVDGVCGITRTNDANVNIEIPKQHGIETVLSGGNYLFEPEPNPVSEIIRIKFSLSDATYAKIVIFDSFGRQTAILHEGQLGSGLHNFQISATEYNISSGVYFYSLVTPEFTDTKTLIVVK